VPGALEPAWRTQDPEQAAQAVSSHLPNSTYGGATPSNRVEAWCPSIRHAGGTPPGAAGPGQPPAGSGCSWS